MLSLRWLNLIIWTLALAFLVVVLFERRAVSYGNGQTQFLDRNDSGVFGGNVRVSDRIEDLEVNYANTITVFKIKAERFEPLRQDATGLYSQEPYIGQASWYGEAFAGRTTACGDIFNPLLFTAASLRHNCGTRLHVCSVDTGRCVDIVVNDTGGFEKLGRVIDLSEGAFAELTENHLERGIIKVEISVL